MKPSQVLAKMCKEGRLEPPMYGPHGVKVAGKTFTVKSDDMDPYRMHGQNIYTLFSVYI